MYIFPKLFPFIFGRLNLIIGYLHSDYSNQLVIEKGDNYNEFKIHELKNKNTDIVIEKTISFIKQNFKKHFFIFTFVEQEYYRCKLSLWWHYSYVKRRKMIQHH